MRQRLQRFMTGRYGVDQLGKFNMALVLIFLILNVFLRRRVLYMIALILLIIAYLRLFSRNVQARYKENAAYLTFRNKITAPFKRGRSTGTGGSTGAGGSFGPGTGNKNRTRKKTVKDKEHKIYKCPGCKQKIRVPAGRGKIEITCPKCRASFIKRT